MYTVIDHGFPLIGGDVDTDRVHGTIVALYIHTSSYVRKTLNFFVVVPVCVSDGDNDGGGGGSFLLGSSVAGCTGLVYGTLGSLNGTGGFF